MLNSLIPSGGSKKTREPISVLDMRGVTGYPRWKGVSENAATLRLEQGESFPPLKSKNAKKEDDGRLRINTEY